MNPFVAGIQLSSLALGVTVTFACTLCLLPWLALAIYMLPNGLLMAQRHDPSADEVTTKYSLTQATAGAMMLLASTTHAWVTWDWDVNNSSNPVATTLSMAALALKIGLAPMHLWMSEILQALHLLTALVMSSCQQLALFALIIQTAQDIDPLLLWLLGITSTLIRGWGGLNETQLRKILAYTSIAHIGCMILVFQFAPLLSMLVLATFIIMSSGTLLTSKMCMTSKFNTLATSWSKSPMPASTSAVVLLSLGGLPRLTGFMPKWLIMQALSMQDVPIIAMTMAVAALIRLYFYLRLCYAMTLPVCPNTTIATTPWRTQSSQTPLPPPLFFTATLGLLAMTPTNLMLTT
uniref:NADH-ubiquinone oxidoreductase chain 2 n=1 Tax=Acrossocheilus paradoxus TaxID=76593 RepID=A0A125R6X0_ACRPD|nr:NADH dehydrogenase subunit 2 [Acrossocheilus paradoxus]AMD11927.1 NADH dehydrogenase subunit 2 [Acrossocheilus paradoxus]